MAHYLGFWCYARLDDQDNTKLSDLRERLELEIYTLSGHRHNIFQDQANITIGHDWDGKLHAALADADFLIPIITPLFFNSEACRAEVDAFVKREQQAGTHDLILPIYWIDALVLNDEAQRSTDRIARIIHQHQWDDWRDLRHTPIDAPETHKPITALAKKILARHDEYEQRRLTTAAITGEITWPHDQQHVLHRTSAAGVVTGLPPDVGLWFVVINHGKLHPQAKLQPDKTGAWSGTTYIGGREPNSANGQRFRFELAAVTNATSRAFERYRKDGNAVGEWHGIKAQQGYRTVQSAELIRDDTIRDWRIEGAYDEHAPGPTGVTITVTKSGEYDYRTAAKQNTGMGTWVGTLRVERNTPDIGSGTYSNNGATNDGIHEFRIDRAAGKIFVTGRSTKNSAVPAFQTIWVRKE
ncbi:MAG: toll/interleukin-1 receptor domain-containing protein [Terriglobia bacterium]